MQCSRFHLLATGAQHFLFQQAHRPREGCLSTGDIGRETDGKETTEGASSRVQVHWRAGWPWRCLPPPAYLS